MNTTHQAVEAAEREKFEDACEKLGPRPVRDATGDRDYVSEWDDTAWSGWKMRAALTPPQEVAAEVEAMDDVGMLFSILGAELEGIQSDDTNNCLKAAISVYQKLDKALAASRSPAPAGVAAEIPDKCTLRAMYAAINPPKFMGYDVINAHGKLIGVVLPEDMKAAGVAGGVDFRPHFPECVTPEPSLSAMIYRYYRQNFEDRATADGFASRYIVLLEAATQAQPFSGAGHTCSAEPSASRSRLTS